MYKNPQMQYLKTRVLTATPGELLVMLYDGLLQRLRQSKLSIEENRIEKAGELLGSAHDILGELMTSLDAKHSPELAENLLNLYLYCKELLIKALAELDTKHIDEAHDLLVPLREAWAEAEKSLRKEDQRALGG
ncbi:MAG: flagellar export chaperone FliS [Myxococcota bacterium]|nr:flagellar export chaperone FliS [Myxococcota bacterium]